MKIKKVKFIAHNERAKRMNTGQKIDFLDWLVLDFDSMVLMFDFC